jgi:glycosyltransferase involved in cell wall biosynthesis
MRNNHFVFVIPTFNNERTIQQTLMSIVSQSYPNWSVRMRDDMSTDSTVNFVRNFAKAFGIEDRFHITENEEKFYSPRNVLEETFRCNDDDIICRIDGDDWLCDLDALAIINHRYDTLNCDILWTKHRWNFDNNMNISGILPKNADPYKHPWVSSHFRTFRKGLINRVNPENFRDESGEHFTRLEDQSIFLPLLTVSEGNWHFEPITAYHYTIDMRPQTFQTDAAKYQKSLAEFVRNRGFIK